LAPKNPTTLAGDRLVGLDPGTGRHLVDRTGDLDHEAAHADDAAVDLDPVQFADLFGKCFYVVARMERSGMRERP
jgi:hypothetical protein